MAGKRYTFDSLSQLRASSAMSPGSESGSGVDLGATAVVRAICNITANAGTLTLNLRGSATEGGSYYNIPGTAFLDPDDGAVMDETGSYEVYFKTNFRWIRHEAVVGTGAVTFSVDVADIPG